ncbi:MAG: pyridoxal phosphate-dependent aminotransferase [Bacteroidia bacterium]|nr:pyridoxal phosphate-dependent aminotransferase [Bacteroidia bacterium]
MPSISLKGVAMPASPIRKLVPFAEAAKKRGIKIYHLNIGQPDVETPQIMLDAIKNYAPKVVEYSHSAGNESYRRKLVGYYAGYNINLTHEDMIITCGGSEAIEIALMTCLNEGDELIIPEPFYANYNGFSTQAGVKVVPVTSSIDNGFALPAIAEFEKKITARTKAIMICNPGNPTGYLYNKEELEQLRDLVVKHDLYLLSDEVYREFCYEKPYCSVMQLSGADDNMILIDSVSKRYSACGARIGALITKNKEVIAAAMKFAQARLSPPSFGQVAAEAAIDTPQSYFDNVKAEYIARRNVVVQRLNAMPGVKCPNPTGAFYCIAELPITDCDHFCQWLLESFQHNNETLMLAPASGFYSNPAVDGKNQVRIAYVLNIPDLNKAMDCLEEALKQYKN